MENIQSIDELELFFADLVENLTGLESNKVLIQNQRTGQPSSKHSEDVAYVKISPEPDERSIYKNRKLVYNKEKGNFTSTQYASRTLSLNIIFYGPTCYELCTKFNEMMYFSSTSLLLNENKLSLIPDRTNGPIRNNELHNGQWWRRCDLELRFYNEISIVETIESIDKFDIRMEDDI